MLQNRLIRWWYSAATGTYDDMPQVGDILGEKYRLVRVIGEGGMGRVYEAEHLELAKKVAIKFPHAEITENQKELARFKREPRAVAATGHPGVVDVYDVGTTRDGLPYVVMEYLQGESLATLLARERRLDVSLATSVIAQVLSAIDAAHAKKIVHRDLKPDNVFLVDTGQPVPAVKILDFGTSKVIEGATGSSKLTEKGAILGTPFYMAPEQILDEDSLDHRLDIYAVGVMFYELLTGQLPFTSTNVLNLAHKVLNDRAERPRSLRPDIPEGLEEVVLRAMARDRRRRFRSAAAMLQALLPFLDERSLGQLSLPAALRSTATTTSPSSETEEVVVDPSAPTLSTDGTPPGASITISKSLAGHRQRSLALVAALLIVLVAAVGYMVATSTSDDGTSAAAAPVLMPEDPRVPRAADAGGVSSSATEGDASLAAADADPEASAADDAGGGLDARASSPRGPRRGRTRPPHKTSETASQPARPEPEDTPGTPPQKEKRGLEFTNEWQPE